MFSGRLQPSVFSVKSAAADDSVVSVRFIVNLPGPRVAEQLGFGQFAGPEQLMNSVETTRPAAAAPDDAAARAAFEHEIAGLIVEALNLDVTAAQIDPEAPLYRDGLGLDSIDILEVALVVAKHYGLHLKADSEDNFHIFKSLRSLAAYVAAHRSK